MPMALCRPVEINDDNKNFSISYDGGGAVALTLPTGVYGSILTVLDELEDTIQASVASTNVYLSTTWHTKIAVNLGHTLAITWTDPALGLLLGYDGDCTAAQINTAAYTPEYCWFPAYEASDPDAWRHEPTFAGSNAVNGLLAGLSFTPGRYTRTLEFPAERDYNAKISRAATVDTFGATTFYPQQRRCFEQFATDVLAAAPTDTDSEGINMHGFYVVHDRSVYAGAAPSVAIPSSMDSGGVDTEFDTSPDRYVYVCPVAGAMPGLELFGDRQNIYYTCSLAVMTATAPPWNRP